METYCSLLLSVYSSSGCELQSLYYKNHPLEDSGGRSSSDIYVNIVDRKSKRYREL